MSLRLSPEEAAKRGIITQAEADAITKSMLKGRRRKGAGRASTGSKSATAVNPQDILFQALCERLPGLPEAEKEELVPNRKFRADVFIPPNIVVEMDGYQFHSSKSAFQKDRERENLFAAHGYRVFRTYAKEVLDAERRQQLVELIAAALEGRVGQQVSQ